MYETLVSIYYGKQRHNMVYRDYSDGINLLFVELYIDEDEKITVFEVKNFEAKPIELELIEEIRSKVDDEPDEEMSPEEFYIDFLD